LIRST